MYLGTEIICGKALHRAYFAITLIVYLKFSCRKIQISLFPEAVKYSIINHLYSEED